MEEIKEYASEFDDEDPGQAPVQDPLEALNTIDGYDSYEEWAAANDVEILTNPEDRPEGQTTEEQMAAPAAGGQRDISAFESALAGIQQGATFGFSDEIMAGINSMLSPSTYDDEIKKWRGYYDAAKTANPKSFLAGDVGAGLATSFIPGLGAGGKAIQGLTKAARGAGVLSKANLAKNAALMGRIGLEGAVTGLGYSEEEKFKDQLKDAAKGAGTAAVVGGVFGGIGEMATAIKNTIKKSGRGMTKFIFEVDDDTINKFLKRTDEIQKAPTSLRKVTNEILEKKDNMIKKSYENAKEAKDILDGTGIFLPKEQVKKLVREKQRKLYRATGGLETSLSQKGGGEFEGIIKSIERKPPTYMSQFSEGQKVLMDEAKKFDNYQEFVKKARKTDLVDRAVEKEGVGSLDEMVSNIGFSDKEQLFQDAFMSAHPDKISLKQVKEYLDELDELVTYGKPGVTAAPGSNAERLLKELRHDINEQGILKSVPDKYKEVMRKNQEITQLAKDIDGLARTPDNYENVFKKIKRGGSDVNKEGTPAWKLKRLGDYLGKDYIQILDDMNVRDKMMAVNRQGSRANTFFGGLGGTIGGTIGGFTGGPVGAGMGGGLGTVGGLILGRKMEQEGGKYLMKGLTKYKDLSKILNNPKLKKWQNSYVNSMKRGYPAVAATHYALLQRDPEYRDAVRKIQEYDVE